MTEFHEAAEKEMSNHPDLSDADKRNYKLLIYSVKDIKTLILRLESDSSYVRKYKKRIAEVIITKSRQISQSNPPARSSSPS